MGIIDEMKEINSELTFNFTQDQWENALIESWRKQSSVGRALILAANIPSGQRVTGEEWVLLKKCTKNLRPSLHDGFNASYSVTRFIATNCKHANNALWDGKYDLAKKLLKHGGKDTSRGITPDRVPSTMTISARSIDKRSDWKTVK